MNIRTYIGHEELTGERGSIEEVTILLSAVRKCAGFTLLAHLNTSLSMAELLEEKARQLAHGTLAANLLDDRLFNALKAKFPTESPESRPVFHRQQLLFVMKLLLRSGRDDPIDGHALFEWSDEEKYLLGSACTMANDLLTPGVTGPQWNQESPTESIKHSRRLELLAELLPTHELTNAPDIFDSLARTRVLFELMKSGRKPVLLRRGTLAEVFLDCTGLELEDYLCLTYGLVAHFVGRSVHELFDSPALFFISRQRHFAKLNFRAPQIDAAFALLSTTFSTLVDTEGLGAKPSVLRDQYDFTLFRKHPLVSVGDDATVCADVGLLVEKCSQGIYHTLLNAVDIDERPKFFVGFGMAFEEYVSMNVAVAAEAASFDFFDAPMFVGTKSEYEGFDGLLVDGLSCVAMEYKGGYLNAPSKYGGDAERLASDIDKKYGAAKGGAVEQLVRKIELVFHREPSKRRSLEGITLSKVQSVYPVIVVQDRSMDIWLAAEVLREAFCKEIVLRALDAVPVVWPLVVMTIDDLQELLPYVEARDFKFETILKEYARRSAEGNAVIFTEVLAQYRRARRMKRRVNVILIEDYKCVSREFKDRFVDMSD